MESDEKVKRFRLHVVKEIYETEKDYTESLEFTVEHIKSKLELKADNDGSISKADLEKLFSNISELLATHKRLIEDLDATIGSNPSYDSSIAQCYLEHDAGLRLYKVYGENNEHAQKLLYELEKNQSFKAFCVGLLLLGGKTDVSISSYLFKPIQRICKYPLLFRELLKYTPVDHSDYNATNHALSMMKDICSVINEAKRRVERLEAIADWQTTVDGWEGSPVIDTCSELVKEGQLVKISAGNIQERVFFLFDNLLVYCKRNSALQLRSKAEKPLYFRGRIPVANIEIENIEDGTCDYQTSRVQVNFGWKVRNLAKNKWFVLIAKSPSEKQQWIDAIRCQKERIERARAGLARETRTLMLDKGDKLHRKLVNETKILQDHRYRFKSYSKSFTGSDFNKWLIDIGEASDSNEAVRLGQALLENGVIHHVADRHQFKNSQLIYRFRVDDGTLHLTNQALDTLAKGLRVYLCLHSLFDPLIRDQRSGLRLMKSCVSGSKLVDWLVEEGFVQGRDEAVEFCSLLMTVGILKHVTNEQKFKDNSGLLYQFVADSSSGNDQLQVQMMDFVPIATCPCQAVLIPYDSSTKSYGIEIDNGHVVSVSPGSYAEQFGICCGQEIIGIGGYFLNNATNPVHLCMNTMDYHSQMEAPLELIVKRSTEEHISLKTKSLGFQLKGSRPVVFSKVEKGLEAAMKGISPGCCILEIEGTNVAPLLHDDVIEMIKKAKEAKKEEISMKVGIWGTHQLVQYQYESTDDMLMDMSMQIMESPFIFSVPGMLFKLYDEEARRRAKLLSQRSKETTEKVDDYITELQVQADNYRKASNSLSIPRYPSFRPFGSLSSRVVESCAINLHSIIMEVGPSQKSSTSPTPSLDPDGSLASSLEGSSKNPISGYCINSMAMPCLMNRTHTVNHVEILRNCQKIRNLLAKLDQLYSEIMQDSELLQRLSQDSAGGGGLNSPMMSTLPRKFRTGSAGSRSSPSSSPKLGSFSLDSPHIGLRERTRARNVSFSNPSPLVKIVLDGIFARISQLEEVLNDEAFNEALDKGKVEIKKIDPQTLLSEWLCKLDTLKSELSTLPNDLKAVKYFANSTTEKVKSIKTDAEFFLEVALAEFDNVEATDAWDRLFSHCLAAVVTGFSNQLLLAAKGHLNHTTEFVKDSATASQQWLEFIAARGVLVCFKSLFHLSMASEVASMKDMAELMNCFKLVNFYIKETSKSSTPLNGNLISVSLNGNHNQLNVTFELSSNLLEYIPESILSGEAITLHPVLFNSSLQGYHKNGSSQYEVEQEINMASLLEIKDYYRGLRQYSLSKAVIPTDAAEKTVALQEASQPLIVLDNLVQQLEGNILKQKRPGTQIQIILSELAHRMGSVYVVVCDSGIHSSQSCVTLEQSFLLCRCHGLPCRSFRTALATLRKTASLPYIARKNSVQEHSNSLDKSPWTFKLSK